MKCGNCGKTIPNDSKFCPFCGVKLVTAAPQPQKQAPAPKQAASTSAKRANSRMPQAQRDEKLAAINTRSTQFRQQPAVKEKRGCLSGCLLYIVVIVLGYFLIKGAVDVIFYFKAASDYKEAIVLAKQGEWSKVSYKLFYDQHEDEKYQVLFNYARAQEYYAKGEGAMAIYCLKQIPDSYNGEFASEIRQFKKTIYPFEKQYNEQFNKKYGAIK